MLHRPHVRYAFTLLELIVVVAIIALLIAVLLPALASARREARLTRCLAQVRQVGVAGHSYVIEYKDTFPFPGPDWPDQLVAGGFWPADKAGMFCPIEVWRAYPGLIDPGFTYAMSRALIGNYYPVSQPGPLNPANRYITPIKLSFIAESSRANFFTDGNRQGAFYDHYDNFTANIRFGHPSGPNVHSPPHSFDGSGFGSSINATYLDGSSRRLPFHGRETDLTAFRNNGDYEFNHSRFWGFDQPNHEASLRTWHSVPLPFRQ